jgi:hypothetical protein
LTVIVATLARAACGTIIGTAVGGAVGADVRYFGMIFLGASAPQRAQMKSFRSLGTAHNSHSIGNSDMNETQARCQKLVPGSVSWRTNSLRSRFSQYNSPSSDRRTS